MIDNKSIWILKQYAVPPELPGNTRHFELGRRLVQRGYEITIFAASFHYSLHRDLRLKPNERFRIEEVEGIKFVWVPTFPFYSNNWRRVAHMVSFMFRCYFIGRKLSDAKYKISPPDLIIGCSIPPFAALGGYWLSKYHHSRFFFEVGDLWPQTLIDMGAISKGHPFTRFLTILERFLYKKAERIITPLPTANYYMQGYGVSKEKVFWVPNGVDTKAFIRQHNVSQITQQFIVIYAGVHGYAQALETVIEASKAIKAYGYEKIKFLFVGDGREKPKLIQLAKDNHLSTCVEFRDSVPKRDMPDILAKASVAVFSLRDMPVFEKYGVGSKKLFDYLAAGLPVIFAVKSSNNPIEEAQCGVTVTPCDSESMAHGILDLYNLSKEELRAMGERARSYAESHYDWSVVSNNLELLIESQKSRLSHKY